MKTTKRQTKLAFRRLYKATLACALTVACALHSQQVEAYFVPVIDAAAIQQRYQKFMEDYVEWGKTAVQYGKEIEQWGKTINFWQTQLVKLQSLQFELFNIAQQYEPVALDYGVAERCPGASTDIISQFKSLVTSALTKAVNADGNIADRQNQICVAMVVAENKKYNFTVDYFKQLDNQTSMLVKLEALRLTMIGESTANMTALTGDTTRYETAMATAKATWETNILQQDNEIYMLKQQQSIFARRAMNGQPTLIGSLVNAAVLKAALTVNR